MNQIDTLSVNAIRILSADAIQKANSGHPGLPLGCAAAAYELWAHHMNHNPANPKWENRDRFILSGGHGSMLLYSLLHLFGYGDLSKEDLMNFRQLGSLTPGHPEYRHTVGVEATTGPLGAGMGMAVGMAMAEAHLESVFNKENYPVVDHYTYVLGGDGCMMEGISSEAFSLAGTLGLSKLIVLYDSNRISIEGSTDIAFRENVQERMQAFGFQTITVEDGNDIDAIGKAIEAAKADTEHPSFITIKTQIGFGCPAKQGKASAHGEPLGVENVEALRKNLNWPSEEPFFVPEEVYKNYSEIAEQKAEVEAAWNVMFAAYCEEYPEMEALWNQYHNAKAGEALKDDAGFWAKQEKPEASRAISGRLINYIKDSLGGIVPATYAAPQGRITVIATPYTDVLDGNWAVEAVNYVTDKNFMKGLSETTFGPNGALTRGMLVTVLYRMAGSPEVTGKVSEKFTDCTDGSWYADAVLWASAHKIVDGYEDGTYKPTKAISRQEMAKVLYGYDKIGGKTADGITDLHRR